MHIHFLDPFITSQSAVHRLDPRVKFVLAVAFILTVALTPSGGWPVYILLFALAMGVVVLSELGVGFVLKRAVLALPFVLAALPVIFTLPGEPLFRLPLGPWTLTGSAAGLERFVSIALKSWISVQIAIVLSSSTPFPELMMAMRAVRIPRLLVTIFGLMWRYLFVLADEAMRLLRARSSRSGATGLPGMKVGGSIPWRGRVAGGLAGNLFLRAIERSDRIYVAMLSRGYDGEVRDLPLPPLRTVHWLLLIGGVGLLGMLAAFGFLFYG